MNSKPASRFVIAAPALALALLAFVPSGAAQAACSSAPAPGVDWRRCLLDRRELPNIDLSRAVLRDASFQRGNLAGAKLVELEAPDVRLGSTNMQGADLTRANLRDADLTRTDMRRATLREADLRRARLFRTDLRGADLTGANLDGADLNGAILGGARWLDGTRVCADNSVGSCQ